jgi:preprotein translocase subunit SecE
MNKNTSLALTYLLVFISGMVIGLYFFGIDYMMHELVKLKQPEGFPILK